MEQINAALAHNGPLEQQLLSSLARRSLRDHLQRDDHPIAVADLQLLWKTLSGSVVTPNTSDSYLAAACNSVSVFLLTASKAPQEAVRSFVESSSVWNEGYHCVKYAFSCGKTKPPLQVLESLAHLLKEHSDQPTASKLLFDSASSMVSTVLTDEPEGCLKASCISLSCFCKKTTLLSELNSVITASLEKNTAVWKQRQFLYNAPASPTDGYTSLQTLFLALLFAITSLETRSAALKLFAQLCSNDGASEQAAQVLEHYIRYNQGSLSDFADNVLPVILDSATQFRTFLDLYSPDKLQSESRLILYLAVLKVGRLKSFVSEDDLPSILNHGLKHHVVAFDVDDDSYRCFRVLLQAGNGGIRLRAYDLITASFATKATIPAGVLRCLNDCLRYLHDDNDAYERGELLGITRRFLKRLDTSYTSFGKLHSSSKLSDSEVVRMGEYEAFLTQLSRFLSNELETGVSYQRHVLALQTFQLLLRVSYRAWTTNQLLHSRIEALILDAYDDVRALSASLLSSIYRGNTTSAELLDLSLVTKVVSLAADSCRQDHADAAGRMLAVARSVKPANQNHSAHAAAASSSNSMALLTKLENHLNTSQELRSDSLFPLHAYILGLVHIHGVFAIEESEISRVLHICTQIWLLTQPQLCIDSPETGTEDMEDEVIRGPKDLLAYTWRALRDSSLLLQTLMKWDQIHFEEIGALCLEQLTRLRHRGAFSTVAQTFALCCEKARSHPDENIRRLISKWYENALAEIDVQARKVTRRSAGLPAMFNAILSPDDARFFATAMSALKQKASLAVSEEESARAEQSLPQVHALNCLKDIINHSKFRSITEPYSSEMIELAADKLSSDLWAIRNCGLMLLRACMTRLNHKTIDTSPISHDPGSRSSPTKSPIDVAIQLLEDLRGDVFTTEHSSRGSEKTFAALDLVRHVGSSREHDRSIRDLIRPHLGSSIWAIRDHAARVLAVRVAPGDEWSAIAIEYAMTPSLTENELHGRLLFLRYSLDIVLQQVCSSDLKRIVRSTRLVLEQIAQRRQFRNVSPFSEAAMLDIVNIVLRSYLVRGSSDEMKSMALALLEPNLEVCCPTSFYRQRRMVLLLNCFLLNGQGQDSLLDDVCCIASADLDDAWCLAEYLEHLVSTLHENSRNPALAEALVHIISDLPISASLGLLMTIVATCLEVSKIELAPKAARALLQRCTSITDSQSRQFLNAVIRLQAALFSILDLDDSEPMSTPLLRTLVNNLSVAAHDELEFPTRLNAAHAVSSCIELVLGRRHRPQSCADPEIPLHLLMILYDELNDDDEEIREVAQSTALKAFAILRGGDSSAIRLCALSARQLLLRLLPQSYGNNPAFLSLAMSRVVGVPAVEVHHGSNLFNRSLGDRVGRVLTGMNNLFAEERQNLYVDELQEIADWSCTLQECNDKAFSPNLWSEAARWSVTGIEYLRSTPSIRSGGSEGLKTVGLTFNSDILELCMRVIHLSKALVSFNVKAADQASAQEVMALREALVSQLSAWQRTLHKTHAHPLLAATICNNG
ncbi:uncharacterized protein HMPREF1541_05953 [Cyphellophora europaea CBS 101466]|uniref:Uncharacterized protein n=1 Tax=Cyphellophora europaea (strain CBS 101466) TaxID=1220924 RepID=W2RTE7_CYPE1|nr:uncharacterized protein HMPREF1541_05953 [Cyphellophora europaea CBS 101466]ETN39727.1 hypothetical protein HMPREF1541_05953 [Cyphellophora europaea CBS 101466]